MNAVVRHYLSAQPAQFGCGDIDPENLPGENRDCVAGADD
jgi:hypothetical protein